MGGFIIDNASWRWIFLVNVPIGVLGYVLAVRRLPIDEPEEAGRLDVVGFLLMGIGLPLFTYAFAEVGEGTSFLSWRGGGLVLVSVVLMGLFVRHALRTDRPLLNLRLFSNPTYAMASAASFVLGAAVFGPYLVMPLFFQEVQHASPMVAGALFAAQGIGAGVSIRIGGVLGHRVSAGILATCGAIVMIVFTLPLVSFDQATPKIESLIVLAGRGFGIGLAMIPVMAAALASLPRAQLPDGAAQTNVLQRVGSSIATTAIAVLLGHELASHSSGAAGLASAYQDTLWAAVGLAVLVLPFAVALLRRQRHAVVAEVPPPSRAIMVAEATPGLDV
jgi:MFS family permease